MPPLHVPDEQFLRSVLNARGPNAVPYNDSEKNAISDHILELQKVYPTLGCNVEQFHGNDGRTLNLLKVDGTIPIHYQGAKYNIPIVLWLLELYPYQAPLIYVVPTPTMVIKSPHSFVDRNGQVSSPKLLSWQYPVSNLVDAVLEMSHVFSAEPPLYSQPAGGARPAPVQQPHSYPRPNGYPQYPGPPGSSNPLAQQQQQQQQYVMLPSGRGGGGGYPGMTPIPPPPSPGDARLSRPLPDVQSAMSYSHPAPPGGSLPSPPSRAVHSDSMATNPMWGNTAYGGAGSSVSQYGGAGGTPAGTAGGTSRASAIDLTPVQEAPVSAAELESQFRALALEAVARQVAAAGATCTQRCEAEVAKALEVQRSLTARRNMLQAQRDALKRERMGTEGVVAEMGSRTQALVQWLERNEAKARDVDPESLDLAKVFVAADNLSRQAMATQAEDLGIEDTILALDKALHSGVLTVDAYTKQVRGLCRQQYFARALGIKVSTVLQRCASSSASGPETSAVSLSRQDGARLSPLQPYPAPMGANHWASTDGASMTNPLSGAAR